MHRNNPSREVVLNFGFTSIRVPCKNPNAQANKIRNSGSGTQATVF